MEIEFTKEESIKLVEEYDKRLEHKPLKLILMLKKDILVGMMN